MDKIKIVIYGAGSHAKVIIDLVEKLDCYVIAGLIDDNKPPGTTVLNYPLLGNLKTFSNSKDRSVTHAFVALGNNLWRQEKVKLLGESNFILVTLVHPFTSIGQRVTCKPATCLCAGVVIDPETFIGEGVLINDKTEIGHECYIDDYVHIAPGVNCGNHVQIGKKSFIGMGSTIHPGVKVGTHSFVCVGSNVTKDIPDHVKIAGNPARIIGTID